MRKKKYWIYDYETIINTFVAVFENLHSDERHIFIISPYQNDLSLLLAFYKENIQYQDWHLGFNNLAFDSQITEFIIDNHKELSEHPNKKITKEIYNYAQDIINRSDRKEFLDYPEFKLRIKNVDIYKLNYWDSVVKRSSLKYIQYTMDWYNVEEIPHEHYKPIEDIETLNMVVEYCINDVKSTKAIYNYKNKKDEKIMISQINLRAHLSSKFNVNLYSAAEPKISREIFLHFLSKKLGIDKKELREKRTYRDIINIKDLILPYIDFKNELLLEVKKWFEDLTIDVSILTDNEDKQSNKGPKKSIDFFGTKIDYSLGGIHGVIKKGIYRTGNGKTIKTCDVKSYYPNLAIKNKWHPAHLPAKEFCEQYEWFYYERLKYPKTDPLNYLYKIVLNSSYGLSKNRYSFLYDPIMPTQICISGQLLLSMFADMVMDKIPTAQPLMFNTDGCEFLIPNEYLKVYDNLIKEWEILTGLELEVENYSTMYISDVNNYISVYTNGKTKCKGRFEFEDLPLHKNKSNLIIPKAIYNYFLNGIKPEKYLEDNKNIYDYCSGVKAKGDWRFWKLSTEHGQYKEEKLNKIVRYYISNSGCKIVKRNPDGREIQTESGEWMQTIFNKYEKKEWEDYNININYYLTKIYEEIENIQGPREDKPVQLTFNF
jgi:hypothetical protein